MNTIPGTAIDRYSNRSCRLPFLNRYDCMFIQEFPCCSVVRKCNTATMKTYCLIQFRIISMLSIYPHPNDLNSFIILHSMSLIHTWSPEGKGCTWRSADILNTFSRYIQATFSQGKALLARAQAGARWTREPVWTFRRIQKSLPWCTSNPNRPAQGNW